MTDRSTRTMYLWTRAELASHGLERRTSPTGRQFVEDRSGREVPSVVDVAGVWLFEEPRDPPPRLSRDEQRGLMERLERLADSDQAAAWAAYYMRKMYDQDCGLVDRRPPVGGTE